MIPPLMLNNIADPVTRVALKQIDDAITSVQRLLSNTALKAQVPMIVGGGIKSFLTDNSGGTASGTIAAISDPATKNAIASLTASVNKIIAVIIEQSKAQP